MVDLSFLRIMDDHVRVYNDFPLPVVICDRDFQVHWSNALAKSLYPHTTTEQGLRTVLSEFDLDELCERVDRYGTCTLGDALPFSDARVSISPMIGNGVMAGLIVSISGSPSSLMPGLPDIYKTSRASEALTGHIRGVVDEVFSAMDNISLKSQLLSVDWTKKQMNRIGLGGYRILRIADNITAYSNYQSGSQSMNFAGVDLPEWLDNISGSLSAIGGTLGIPVTVNVESASRFAQLDMPKFELAFYNVLHNSFYFTRPGNSVHIDFEKRDELLCVTITDRGLGIPNDVLPSLFRPYFTYTHDGVGSGMGLGLALAQRILHSHDGDISISSRYGEGTTVTMTLPEFHRFSQNLPLAYGPEQLFLSDAFSGMQIGLIGALSSPFRNQPDTAPVDS